MAIRDVRLDRAKQEVFDAIRFLAPDEAEKILRDLADSMKHLAEQYDRQLLDAVFS